MSDVKIKRMWDRTKDAVRDVEYQKAHEAELQESIAELIAWAGDYRSFLALPRYEQEGSLQQLRVNFELLEICRS